MKAAAAPCAYSIGRRLSLLLAIQTVIGLGVLLAFIYGATTMLFTAKHEEELRSYTAVLVDVVREAEASGGEAEVKAKLAWLAERRPGTFVQVNRADGSVLYRDETPSFDLTTSVSKVMPFTVERPDQAGPLQGTLILDCSQDAQTARRIAWLLVAAVLAGAALVGWGTFWRVRCDLQPLVADRRRHVVQQAGPVAPVHLDHGVSVRRVVVDHDARRHRHRAQPGRFALQLADFLAQPQPAGQ
jgi:two-component system heavy metal sensor histidine kinase CusS